MIDYEIILQAVKHVHDEARFKLGRPASAGEIASQVLMDLTERKRLRSRQPVDHRFDVV